MNNLKTAVIVLALITIGLGGYIIYKEFIAEKETVNVTEYETKISTLEKENKKLKEELEEEKEDEECPETKCEPSTELPKFTGTYKFGDPNQKESCGDTPDKMFKYEVTFNDDGTADFNIGILCGTRAVGHGKYYVNENEIVIVDRDCDGSYICSYYEIFNYNGDRITAESEYMGKKYTIELIKN